MLDSPPEPSKGQQALSIGREAALACLAFAAGFGAYIGTLKTPATEQDYYGAIGAGALLALAKLIPTNGGQGRG